MDIIAQRVPFERVQNAGRRRQIRKPMRHIAISWQSFSPPISSRSCRIIACSKTIRIAPMQKYSMHCRKLAKSKRRRLKRQNALVRIASISANKGNCTRSTQRRSIKMIPLHRSTLQHCAGVRDREIIFDIIILAVYSFDEEISIERYWRQNGLVEPALP